MTEQRGLPEGYRPSVEDAEWFINYWNELPSYSNQFALRTSALKTFSSNVLRSTTSIVLTSLIFTPWLSIFMV